jgi:hypothetical protein
MSEYVRTENRGNAGFHRALFHRGVINMVVPMIEKWENGVILIQDPLTDWALH